jgi:hypothetical protein
MQRFFQLITRHSSLITFLMIFSAPISFAEALQSRAVRSVLPTDLSSAELAKISSDLLERALFSARVTSAEYLQAIKDVLDQYIDGKIDLASARLQLQQKLDSLGYRPLPDEEGKMTDLSSDARVNLVLRTNAQMAAGYGHWIQGQNKLVLSHWPAQELVRVAPRRVPRNWVQRWSDAGGKFYQGRMIAKKNDDIWVRINRFGYPYPPFDYNSGMGVRDIDRDTALSLKDENGKTVIERDTVIAPQDRGFNVDLQLEPDIRDAALRQALEEEGYTFEDDILTL